MRESRPPEPPPAPARGTVLGAITVLERITIGHMAEILRATEDTGRGEPRQVVVKRMLPHIAAEPGAGQMFEAEAKIGRTVVHPNVVRVLRCEPDAERPFLVLELVEGLDVQQLLRWLRREGRALGIDVALHASCALLAGLHAAHEATSDAGEALEVVHGGVSPANVLVSVDGDVKLSDFGIARARLRTRFPQAAATRTKGSLGYLSPEQVRGEPSDRRSDVFAAAALTAELLIGEPLFAQGSELSILLAIRDGRVQPLLEKADSLPAGLTDVLLKALSKEPSARHATAAELRVELSRFLDGPASPLRAELGSIVARAKQREDLRRASSPSVGQLSSFNDSFQVDGQPMRFSELVEAIKKGSVAPDAEVGVADQAPRRLSDIPSLAGHLPARPEQRAIDPRDLADGGIIGALAQSATSRANGMWVCVRGNTRKEVYLVDGVPEFVSSNLAGELLGEFLVARGVLSRGELDMALAVLPRFDGRIGDTLAALGLVAPVELFGHIADQIREKLLELFLWTDGRAAFHEGVEPPVRSFPLGLDPWRVIEEGVDRRLRAGMDRALFDDEPHRSLHASGRTVPRGAPPGLQRLVDAVQSPVPLAYAISLLDSTAKGDAELDPHRTERLVRLAFGLSLVVWQDPA